MRRLAGADSLFVFNETAAQHQHTLKIAVVDPEGADAPVTFAALRDQMREALPLLEPFRWRLVRVPLDVALPYWVDVGSEVDLEYHVRRAVAPEPGGNRELSDVIASIAGVGLDRDHPLWQIWFVEGLADGRVAYVAKVHHALADGLSSALLLTEIATAERAVTTMPESASLPAERMPTRRELVGLGSRDLARAMARLPALLARTTRYAGALRARRRAGFPGSSKPFGGPATRFDGPLTPERSFAFETLPLADFKHVARAFDATVNDAVLAVVAGALRRYLERRGELPDRALTAAVPVSVREPEEARVWGNRLASWYVTLATDVADPAARIRTISAATKAARAELAETDRKLQHEWAEYQRLFRTATFGVPRLLRPLLHRPSYNVIVSTVPGPPEPVFRHGARLVHMISMGPLVEGMGLNFTAWSYAGEMSIAVMTCRDHAADLWDIVADLGASCEEMRAAADARAPAPR
jgi:WS/DGAT/MGAT family acyltransferase